MTDSNKTSYIVNAAPKVVLDVIPTRFADRSVSVNRRRYQEALSHVRSKEDRDKYPFYEPQGYFNLFAHVVDFNNGEHRTISHRAYFSKCGMICIDQKHIHRPLYPALDHGLHPDALGQYQFRTTKKYVYAQMWSIGDTEHIALFYKQVAKHLSRRNYMVHPHPKALQWPDNDAIQNKLMEYGYPSNIKNAARAGWNACFNFYKKTLEKLRERNRRDLELGPEPTTPISALFPVSGIANKD